jgi:hypothetical protein
MAKFLKRRYVKGHHYGQPEVVAKMAEGVAKAHERGDFVKCCRERKAKTESKRPRCKCGCGRPIARAGAMYARGCFDATTPENQARAVAARDMEKLKAGNSVRMKKQMAEWIADGTRKKHEEKRLAVLIGCDGWGKAKRGRLDHVMAKVWHIRDPRGRTHRFSNLNEWARQNENLFEDDRQSAKLPFWRRIACGISQLDGKNGTSCSYKGWVLVGKQEYIIEGGKDPLGRDVDSLENA